METEEGSYLDDERVDAEARAWRESLDRDFAEQQELEARTPLDHQRRKFGDSEEERQPARRMKLSEMSPEDHAARHRGEIEIEPETESGEG
jgi:hypothetical protein